MKKTPPTPLFISKEGVAAFWFLLAVAALIAGAVYAERLAATKGLAPQFIWLGTTNPMVKELPSERMVDLETELEQVDEFARMLADSVFNKSSRGLDSDDRCKQLLAPEAWKWLNENVLKMQEEAFTKAHMHQKIAVEHVDIDYDESRQIFTAKVSGQLIRTGILSLEIFNQSWKVNASFELERSRLLKHCGMFPYHCLKLAVNEKAESSTQRHLTIEEENSIRARAALESEDKSKAAPAVPPAKP
jgi:hypothetical protein